jgi:hypothetical protein
MNAKPILQIATLLVIGAADACAQTGSAGAADAGRAVNAATRTEASWFSYRDTYRSMIRFEKYGKPKQFIENRLQVVPRDGKEPAAANPAGGTGPREEVRLNLEGNTVHLNLPLDALGRAVFPLLKAAYDDNAELIVNRPAGSVSLTPRISIVSRADGVYDAADLRTACGQVLQYLEYVNNAGAGKRCAGVQFIYARDGAAVSVNFKGADQKQSGLQFAEGKAFADDTRGETGGTYRIVTYRFANWPDKGQIVTNSAPLAVAALLE